jgi:mycobactin lysine-N-oxygenase
MLTGPGRPLQNFEIEKHIESSRILDMSTFWTCIRDSNWSPKNSVAIVGAGENSASILLALQEKFPNTKIKIIAPKGYLVSRAENYLENRIYTQPQAHNWNQLTLQDRKQFIERTDNGVYSQWAMNALREFENNRIVPGRLKQISSSNKNQNLRLCLEYNDQSYSIEVDQVILATGFDQSAWLKELMDIGTLDQIQKMMQKPLCDSELSMQIDYDLSVKGLMPKLHLPMLAGLQQGPGFSNLSCLGNLANQILIDPSPSAALTYPYNERKNLDEVFPQVC